MLKRNEIAFKVQKLKYLLKSKIKAILHRLSNIYFSHNIKIISI